MDCENYEALAVDLLYGELSPEKKADAASHAASCAECGKLSKELDEARKTAATLPARIPPPRELDERVMLAARAAADVRAYPFRGSALHVAAAAVLAIVLVGVSFAVGMKVGQPRIIASDDPVVIVHDRPGGPLTHSEASPPVRPNGDYDSWRKYMEEMLALANEDFGKGEVKRALMEFGGVYSGGGRHEWALEARLGMARCYRALGQLQDARACARDAFQKNDEWGTHFKDVDDASIQLMKQLGDEISNTQRR